jgi:hypothetical protein
MEQFSFLKKNTQCKFFRFVFPAKAGIQIVFAGSEFPFAWE